jgi:hypothetical protein
MSKDSEAAADALGDVEWKEIQHSASQVHSPAAKRFINRIWNMSLDGKEKAVSRLTYVSNAAKFSPKRRKEARVALQELTSELYPDDGNIAEVLIDEKWHFREYVNPQTSPDRQEAIAAEVPTFKNLTPSGLKRVQSVSSYLACEGIDETPIQKKAITEKPRGIKREGTSGTLPSKIKVEKRREKGDTGFVPKLPPKPQDQPQPAFIRLEEVDQAGRELKELQATVVNRFQDLLQNLAGRRGSSDDQNKRIANAVYDAARRVAIQLLYKDQSIYLSWANGVFTLTTTDKSRKYIDSSAIFPHLTAQAKGAVIQKQPYMSSIEENWTASIQRGRKGRIPGS